MLTKCPSCGAEWVEAHTELRQEFYVRGQRKGQVKREYEVTINKYDPFIELRPTLFHYRDPDSYGYGCGCDEHEVTLYMCHECHTVIADA